MAPLLSYPSLYTLTWFQQWEATQRAIDRIGVLIRVRSTLIGTHDVISIRMVFHLVVSSTAGVVTQV